jgi:hypothetical protein
MNLFTVHLCFATTPNNIEYIISIVRITFAELYLNYLYLEKMSACVRCGAAAAIT